MPERKNNPCSTSHYITGLGIIFLVMFFMMSCNSNDGDAESAIDPASQRSCLLRSPTIGDWFSGDIDVTVIGEFGHELQLNHLKCADVKAADATGNTLRWWTETRPDSKFGPMLSIVASTAGASSKSITVEAILQYRRQPIALHAIFEQPEDSQDWKATTVVLRNLD